MFYYTAFGLNIASEIEFPEMLLSTKTDLIDVNIIPGKVPEFLAEDSKISERLWITPNEFLMHFKDVASYYAKNGNLIIADVAPNAEKKMVRLYLLCNAMAAIIHQKKLIPLHSSGIITKKGVALIVGKSGAGKSTTIKALTQKGHPIFTDDVCVLKNENDKVLAIPSYPMMKLWERSFELLDLGNAHEGDKFSSNFNKYSVLFHDHFVTEWQPVSKIFNLAVAENCKDVSITKQTGVEAFVTIGENTYRNYYVEPMKLNAVHFDMIGRLLQQCEVYQIMRPPDGDSIAAVIEIIENTI